MRLAVCALSAVLLSGCSWLGMGGSHGGSYGTAGGAYGANCAPVQGYGAQYGQTAYGHAGHNQAGHDCAAHGYGQGYGAGLGQAGYAQAGYGQGAVGYDQGMAGYGQAGYGQGAGAFSGVSGYGPAGAGYGAGAYGAGVNGAGFGGAGVAGQGFSGQGFNGQGFTGVGAGGVAPGLAAQGIGGAYGVTQLGQTGFGQAGYSQGVTTLGAGAPFGAAAYGGNVVGTQLNNGQYVNGAYVQNVVGQPIYVPQPYAQPYGVPQLRGVGAAMPFGLEVFGGSNFDVSGDIFTAKEPGLALGSDTVNTGGSDGISYDDAFGQAVSVGGTFGYDISRNTTLLGTVGYSTAEGKTVRGYQSVDARGALEDIDATFTDLDQVTLEAGVRQYVGTNPVVRPYIGATGGFVSNNDVDVQRSYSSDAVAYDAEPFEYASSGWNPTASAVLGAEMALGHRGAIGVESGVRWQDNMNTVADSEDRISIPVKLRGRLAF